MAHSGPRCGRTLGGDLRGSCQRASTQPGRASHAAPALRKQAAASVATGGDRWRSRAASAAHAVVGSGGRRHNETQVTPQASLTQPVLNMRGVRRLSAAPRSSFSCVSRGHLAACATKQLVPRTLGRPRGKSPRPANVLDAGELPRNSAALAAPSRYKVDASYTRVQHCGLATLTRRAPEALWHTQLVDGVRAVSRSRSPTAHSRPPPDRPE